jgi:hypothetical protein
MLGRVFPFLICLLLLGVFGSQAKAGFVLPDTLIAPTSGGCGGSENDATSPHRDGSAPGIWQHFLCCGFAFFLHVCEASARESSGTGSGSLPRPPLPEIPCLSDQGITAVESAAGSFCGYRAIGITPYVCRLFRPPRWHAPFEQEALLPVQ